MDESQGIANISACTSSIATETFQNGRKLDKILENMGYAQTLTLLNLIVLVVIAVLIAVHWYLILT